jgi:hypothetical protein
MYFAVCTAVFDLTDDEKRIRDALRKRIVALIER